MKNMNTIWYYIHWVLAGSFLLTLSFTVSGASVDDKGLNDMIRVHFQAIQDGDSEKAVSLLHPDEYKKFKRLLIKSLKKSGLRARQFEKQFSAITNSKKKVVEYSGRQLLAIMYSFYLKSRKTGPMYSLLKMPKIHNPVVIVVIKGKEGLTHVGVQYKLGFGGIKYIDLFQFRKYKDQWKMMLNPKIYAALRQ